MVWEKNITRKAFFFKNQAEDEAGSLVPDLFLNKKAKAVFEVNASGLVKQSKNIYIKLKNIDPEIRSITIS